MSAREAAQRIHDRHRDCGNCEHGAICPEVEDAEVVLAGLREAETALEAILAGHQSWVQSMPGLVVCDSCGNRYPCVTRQHAEAALLAIRGSK